MLNHVNTDIAVDVFEVLSELTDPEVLSSLSQQTAQCTMLQTLVWYETCSMKFKHPHGATHWLYIYVTFM